ncbi:MAG: type restriction enzyme subunit [Thermodesulfobacteriota bacterium]|nr:type restriction enzyme subunit [Thermodesulfobacteriota bacterium]
MSNRITNTALDELVSLQTEKIFANKDPKLPYVGLEHMAQGEPRLLGTANSSTSISVNAVFKKDDVLFGKLRPNLRKSIKAPFDGYCSTDILVLRSQDGVAPDFSAHVFHWERVFSAAVATAAGTKMPRTSWSDLKRFKIFKPESASAQSRIAYVLDTIDEAIARTEGLIAKLKQVRAGMLHALLSYGLDEHGQLRDPASHPEQFKDSPLGLIPKEWEVCTLAELAIEKLVNGVFKEPKRVGSGVPLVNVADLYKGESVDLEACELFSVTKDEITRYGVLRGDIFFTRSSLKLEGIAQTSFMFTDAGDAVFECHVMRLRPDTKKIVPRFLKEWCAGDFARRHFMAHAKQVTMTTISQDGVSRLLCPRPDLTEQEKAVSIIEAMADSLLNEITIAQKLRFLKIALQDDLLTGRVRVPETIMEGAERE